MPRELLQDADGFLLEDAEGRLQDASCAGDCCGDQPGEISYIRCDRLAVARGPWPLDIPGAGAVVLADRACWEPQPATPPNQAWPIISPERWLTSCADPGCTPPCEPECETRIWRPLRPVDCPGLYAFGDPVEILIAANLAATPYRSASTMRYRYEEVRASGSAVYIAEYDYARDTVDGSLRYLGDCRNPVADFRTVSRSFWDGVDAGEETADDTETLDVAQGTRFGDIFPTGDGRGLADLARGFSRVVQTMYDEACSPAFEISFTDRSVSNPSPGVAAVAVSIRGDRVSGSGSSAVRYLTSYDWTASVSMTIEQCGTRRITPVDPRVLARTQGANMPCAGCGG